MSCYEKLLYNYCRRIMSLNENKLKNISVLLVEDNEMNTLLTSVIVEGLGADVTQANNGKQAIDLLEKGKFDVILMDLHMPLMNGFETTRFIRNNLGLQTPVIAITANVVNDEKNKCIEAGMNGFITKPYTDEVLFQVITACLTTQN